MTEKDLEKDDEVVDITDPLDIEEAEEVQYNHRMEMYKELIDKRNKEKDQIKAEVKVKYPGIRLFTITLPYNGTFVLKAQEMHDMKFISGEVEKFVEDELNKKGGRSEIEKISDPTEKERIYKEIDASAADYSNELLLQRCVLYPYNMKEMLSTEEPGKGLPIGAASLLLERLVDISGWQDVIVEEI